MVPFLYIFYRFGRSVWLSLKDPEFEALATLLTVVLVSGTFFYHYNEGWSWIDSLFFSVVTLTTVGYGNMYPTNDASKIFTIVFLFIGIGVLLGFINFVAGHAIEDQKKTSILPWRNRKSSS